MSHSKYAPTSETTNTTRILLMISGPCTDLLREALKMEIKPNELSKKVKEWIDSKPSERGRGAIFSRSQYEQIFPLPSKNYGGDYSDLEICLLYLVLRNISNIPPHCSGWGKDPNPGDRSVSANVERIRLIRNKYFHRPNMSLSDKDFLEECRQIRFIAAELQIYVGVSNVYPEAIDYIKKCPIDLNEGIEKMIRATIAILEDHQLKMESLFVKTRASVGLMKLLDQNGHVVIKGNPGSGKTTLARYTLSLLAERGKRPLQIYSIKDLYGYVSSDENLAIFIDNMYGEYSLNKEEVHEFDIRGNFLQILTKKNVKGTSNVLIMTIRNDIYNECTKMAEKEMLKSSLIDISSGEYELQIDEMETFLESYGLHGAMDYMDLNSRISEPLGFPQCCRLMQDKGASGKEISDFLKKPLLFLKTYLETQLNEKPIPAKNSVLIYLLLNGGVVHSSVISSSLDDIEKKRISTQMIGIDGINFIMTFQKSLKDYIGFLITTDPFDDVYLFSHSSVHESIFKVLCSYYPDKIIENCDPCLLKNLSTNPNSNSAQVRVNANVFHTIILRIIKIIKEQKVSGFESISLLDLWNDSKFVETFKTNKELMVIFSTTKDKQGNSLMVHFARAGNVTWIKYLLPHSDQKQRYLSLNAACARNQENIIDEILSTNVNYDLTTCFYAVQSGNLSMLQRLCSSINLNDIALSLHPMWLFVKGSLLREICLMGQNQFIDPILDYFPNLINVKDEQSSNTLHFVAYAGEIDTFKVLVKKGCNPFERTKIGSTVLHFACQGGKLDMVKYIIATYPELLQAKYNDFDGWSPFHWTAQSGRTDLLVHLVEETKSALHCNNKTLNINDKTKLGKTVLHIACMKGNFEMCEYLVKHYPDLLDIKDCDGENILHDTAWGGNVKLFKYLVQEGLNVNFARYDGKTVLHQCCMNGQVNMCKFILNYHFSLLNIKDSFGYSALHDAAWGGNIELLNFLLGKGLNISCKSSDGKTALHCCCMNGQLDMCRFLLDMDKSLLTTKDSNSCSALHDSAKSQNTELFEYLLSKGLNINDLTKSGKTVLHVACIERNMLMIKYLTSKYPYLVNVKDYSGIHVLHDAAFGGVVSLFKYLVSVCEGLDMHPSQKVRKNVLDECCMNRKLETATHIIDHNSFSSYQTDQDGLTQLRGSVNEDNTDTFSHLPWKGFDVTDRTDTGHSFLHIACMSGEYQMCKYLIDAFPSLLNEKDNTGHTALHAAAWGGNVDILMLLLVYGLDIDMKTNDGKTVLHTCCMNGKMNMCKYLLFYYPHLLKVIDNKGDDALSDALLRGNQDIIEFLLNKSNLQHEVP